VKTALIAFALAACSQSANGEPTRPSHSHQDAPMTDAVTYRESSNPTISERQVGISNIWARDLPDKNGTVASRMSAQLTIYDPATKKSVKEIVYAGSVVAIGAAP
jgi:hypothetical protein